MSAENPGSQTGVGQIGRLGAFDRHVADVYPFDDAGLAEDVLREGVVFAGSVGAAGAGSAGAAAATHC